MSSAYILKLNHSKSLHLDINIEDEKYRISTFVFLFGLPGEGPKKSNH